MSLSNVGAENIIGQWPFAGTANFHAAFASDAFWQAVRTSAIFTGVLLVGDLVLGFITAVWLSQPARGMGLAQALMILAWALPPIVTGTAWKFLLQQDGFVNALLKPFGVGQVEWLSSTKVALWSVIGVVAWASIPFCSMVIRAGLLGIPRDTIEAARVDGANDRQVTWRIVLPQLRGLLATLSVLVIVYGFGGSFSYIFVVTEGGPGTVTTTLPFLGYVDAFTDFDFGIGAAIAVISMVIVGLLALGYLRASGREERTI
jgi:ABC-type sugar transport system permease subunit